MQCAKGIDDCVNWFLYRYPRTKNAFVGGEFLVYEIGSAKEITRVDNWSAGHARPSNENTAISDLLTNSPDDFIEYFGISLVNPVPSTNSDRTIYNFDGIRAYLIRDIAAYLRERGTDASYVGIMRFGETFFGNPNTTIRLREVIKEEAKGSLDILAYWDLDSVIGASENPTLADAIARVFNSYKALTNLLDMPTLPNQKPMQIQS